MPFEFSTKNDVNFEDLLLNIWGKNRKMLFWWYFKTRPSFRLFWFLCYFGKKIKQQALWPRPKMARKRPNAAPQVVGQPSLVGGQGGPKHESLLGHRSPILHFPSTSSSTPHHPIFGYFLKSLLSLISLVIFDFSSYLKNQIYHERVPLNHRDCHRWYLDYDMKMILPNAQPSWDSPETIMMCVLYTWLPHTTLFWGKSERNYKK
jgi:hypothetical protein